MSQPEWKFVSIIGDVDPVTYGGSLIYVDQTAVYPPEVERIEPPEDSVFDTPRARWEVRRFMVEPCTFIDGILSDNKFHPKHAAWFAHPYNPERPQDGKGGLIDLSSFIGCEVDSLVEMFLSEDVRERAQAWITVGDYHGFDNLDSYPLTFKAEEIENRYSEELVLDRQRRQDHKVFRRVWAHHARGGRVYGYASDVKSGLYSPERTIASSVEDAACFRGMGFPEVQVNLADHNDPLDPDNQTTKGN